MDMLLETSVVNSAARDAVNSTDALPCAQSGPKVRPAEETSDRNVEFDEYPLGCSKPAKYEISWLPDEYWMGCHEPSTWTPQHST